MSGYGRGTAEALCTLGQALKIQSDAVDHGTHFNSEDIPADWDPNFGQFVPCPKCLKPVRGVIAYLRSLAGDKNPSTAGLMKVTASSCHLSNLFGPERVLEWVEYTHWEADDIHDSNRWLQLDFLDKRVIVKEYAVYAWGRNRRKVKAWSLFGRNREDEPWEPIDEQVDALEDRDGPVVFPSSKPDRMFRYLRFSHVRFNGLESLPSVEFFGALVILKDPPLDATEPGMVS